MSPSDAPPEASNSNVSAGAPSGNAALTRGALEDWPKAELHCHLDGSLRLETVLELAEEQDKVPLLPAETLDGLREILRDIDDSETLEAYLAWFRYTLPLLQDEGSLRRAARELAEDNVAENVRYLEVRFAPILHTEEDLSVCGLRDRYESASLQQAELAARYRDRGVVAFDIAGGEAGNPPKHHRTACYHARNNLLDLTIHAGESWGPDSIHQALFYCGAGRIGHGTSLYNDPDLMQYVADHQIALEVCPTSNVQTHVVPSLEAHPITRYVEADVPVTINTDNRLFSRTSVTTELWRVHQHCDLGRADLREIVLNGFRHAFLPWDQKQALLRKVTEHFPVAASEETPVW
ncbi:MAG: adenosine deaminase [Bacteroidetes bacterium QS_9_68_14]|nr:MAG: adenosine deaminase [Bacteroidetes bacterium QS_9_68_14]